jgi:hypothetical protein
MLRNQIEAIKDQADNFESAVDNKKRGRKPESSASLLS